MLLGAGAAGWDRLGGVLWCRGVGGGGGSCHLGGGGGDVAVRGRGRLGVSSLFDMREKKNLWFWLGGGSAVVRG